MKYLKKYIITYLITSLEISISCLFLTILYYFDIIADYYFPFLLLLSTILCLFFNSFLLGKSCSKKGYFEGLKLGSCFSITLLTISIITSKFTWKLLLYYFIIIITSILGSIIGINKKKT